MMVRSAKAWFFIVVVVFLATTASCKQVYGVDHQSEWPSFARGRRSPLGAQLPKDSVGKSAYQATPKQAALNGPSIKTEFTGNRTNTEKDKRYSKKPSGIVLNFHPLPQEQSEDVVKKMLKKIEKVPVSFPKLLIQQATDLKIPEMLLQTKYISTMKIGGFDPNYYLHFKNQNVPYLDHVANMYDMASSKMQDAEWAKFYIDQAVKYRTLHENLRLICGVKEEGVNEGLAVKLYKNFLEEVATDDPTYLPVAQLPCSYYWPWITDQLLEDTAHTNVFKTKWIEENPSRGDRMGATEDFVTKHYTKQGDLKKGLQYFCRAAIAELNTFQEAGGEPLTDYQIFIKSCMLHL